ncbi:hypothetical protein [Phaeobacter sp.]|uniref:hypothetical protein n=1 Tax=Phaeobacter sp. TaxID=1902409 RepID=UPI0025FBE754|nr:hypothetical protein [Phaeobacter sp.]
MAYPGLSQVIFCGGFGRALSEISAFFSARGVPVHRVSAISSLWTDCLCLDGGTAVVIVDVEDMGGPLVTKERLLLFRQDLPHVPTIMLTDQMSRASNDLDQLAVCDFCIRPSHLSDDLDIVLVKAFSNNQAWLEQQHAALREEVAVDIRLTVALILSVLAGGGCGIVTLFTVQDWWYAALAYICGGQLTLVALLLMPSVRRLAASW